MNDSMLLNMGKIIACARRMHGLSQRELASLLNVSQPTLSRVERELLIPTVDFWFQIASLLKIRPDSCRFGYMDFESIVNINSQKYENGFLLPLRYANNKCIKVRELIPLLEYASRSFGPTQIQRVIEGFQVEPLFFRILDNQINLIFLDDFVEAIFQNQETDELAFAEVGKYYAFESTHGHLSCQYRACKTEKDLILTYLKEIRKYDQIFDYAFEQKENQIYFSIKPLIQIADHFNVLSANSHIFLDIFRENKLKSLSKFLRANQSNQEKLLEITEQKSIYRDNDETLYVLKFSA